MRIPGLLFPEIVAEIPGKRTTQFLSVQSFTLCTRERLKLQFDITKLKILIQIQFNRSIHFFVFLFFSNFKSRGFDNTFFFVQQ
jgi:hypothetical protein